MQTFKHEVQTQQQTGTDQNTSLRALYIAYLYINKKRPHTPQRFFVYSIFPLSSCTLTETCCSNLYLQDGQWTGGAPKSERSALCPGGIWWDHGQGLVSTAGRWTTYGGHPREVPPGQFWLFRQRIPIPEWREAKRATGDRENAEGLLLDLSYTGLMTIFDILVFLQWRYTSTT